MEKNNLKNGYFIFGNKGNVWSNNAHIFQSLSSLTLCGVPMLSSNWAKIEDVQEIDAVKEQFLSLNPNVQIFDFRSIKNRKDDIIIQILK